MTKFGQLLLATFIVALIAIGAYWFLSGKEPGNSAGLPDFDFAQNLKNAGSAGVGAQSYGNVYENLYWGFTFNYGDDFQIREIDEDNGGFTVLAEGTGEKRIFQIFISDFDEPGPITPERIKKDLPEIKITQPQNIRFADTDALAFVSPDEEGNMVEIWFVKGGALFQMRSYIDLADELSKILSSWKFL